MAIAPSGVTEESEGGMNRNFMSGLAALLLIAIPVGARANLVQNGSLELPYNTGNYIPHINAVTNPGGIPGWTVTQNGVLLQPSYWWPASDGIYSVSMNEFGPGTIAQAIPGLQVGTEYVLTFDYAVNPFAGPLPLPPPVLAFALGDFTDSVSALPNPVSDIPYPKPVNWQTYTGEFIFTGSNVLSFTSQTFNPTTGDVAILDNVSLTAVPKPASFVLLATALLGFTMMRRCPHAWVSARKAHTRRTWRERDAGDIQAAASRRVTSR